MELRSTWGNEVGDGDGGTWIDGVETDAEDDLVGAVKVETLGENAADFHIRGLASRFRGVKCICETLGILVIGEQGERTNVVGPLELDRNLFVSPVIGLHCFHHGNSSNVLNEDYRAGHSEVSWMVNDCRVDETAWGSDPDVCATATAGNLSRSSKGEASRQLGHNLGIPENMSDIWSNYHIIEKRTFRV